MSISGVSRTFTKSQIVVGLLGITLVAVSLFVALIERGKLESEYLPIRQKKLVEKVEEDGTYIVKVAPDPQISRNDELYKELCPLMQVVVRWPLDKPTFYQDFYAMLRPDGIYDAVSANGAYYSNPRVVGDECLVDLESRGIVDGNSYNWRSTCRATEIAITNERYVALKHFDPSSCG